MFCEDDKSGTVLWIQMMISVLGRIENILGKGENAGNQHFLLFPKNFSTLRKKEKLCFCALLNFACASLYNLDISNFLSFG